MLHTTSNIKNSGNNIYYDISLKNLGNSDTRDDIQNLIFDEQRSAPILSHANEYKMSVIRFETSTYSLPVYLAEILPETTDPNLMIHRVEMTYVYGTNPGDRRLSGNNNLIWVPSDKTLPVPGAPSTTQSGFQNITPYYYAYDYEHVLRIVNDALDRAFKSLQADALVNPGLYPMDFQDYESPFMGWNTAENKAILFTRTIFDTSNSAPTLLNPLIELYFNPTLYSMFNSFPINKRILLDGVGQPIYTFPYYQIMVDDFNGYRTNQTFLNLTTERWIETPQQYSTITEMSPIQSLVFTTSTLPIIPNQLSLPHITFNNRTIQLSKQGNNFSNIITDMSTQDQGYRGDLLYLPSGEYRYISLLTDRPISQVDIQVYYRLKVDGNLVAMTLPSGGSCSVKLMFTKLGTHEPRNI